MESTLKNKVMHGLFWKILEQSGSQGIQFVIALLLARLMTPEEYGTISLIMIFITVANTFVQAGFATALIQRESIDDEDYSSVFWISLLIASVCYAGLFASARSIAVFYRTPVLETLVKQMGIVLFPGAVISVQTAYVARKLQFRRLFMATMAAVIVSGIAAVWIALQGQGVFAMATQQILLYFVLMAGLFLLIPWRPGWKFSTEKVCALFSFGWKILVSGLIDTLWQNIYGLVIGKQYSGAELGAYSRGEQFPKIIAANLSQAIQSVMLPAFSRNQTDREGLRKMAKRSVQTATFVIFPMMAGLAAVSVPLVRLLLTERWLPAVPYLVVMCIIYAVYPLHIINLQIINALGRSDLFLRLELIKKSIGAAVLVLSLPLGIGIMLILKAADELLCTWINAWPNDRMIGYGPWHQYRDILPTMSCSLLMGSSVWWIGTFMTEITPAVTLLIQVCTGVVIYGILSLLFNYDVLKYTFSLIGIHIPMLRRR